MPSRPRLSRNPEAPAVERTEDLVAVMPSFGTAPRMTLDLSQSAAHLAAVPRTRSHGFAWGRSSTIALILSLTPEEAQMAGVEVGDFSSPDETRTPDKTTVEVVRIGGASAARMRLEPGWRWSECIKPIVGGERCQAHHVGLLESGTMHVVHDDGSEEEIRAGQAYVIAPGHDAWVVGDEPVIGFEFESRTAEEYAKA